MIDLSMLFQHKLGDEDILHLPLYAFADIAHKMTFLMMSFQTVIVFIVDVLEFGEVLEADVAAAVRADSEVGLEVLEIVESFVSELANGVVEH